MNKHARRGVTLIELMVTMVVSSVVLVGLMSLYMGAASDFRMAARMREERYGRQSLESELVWRLKTVPPDFLPSQDQLPATGSTPGFTISYNDDRGAPQTRKILAYDYLVNDLRTRARLNPPGFDLIFDPLGCSVRIPVEPASYAGGPPEKVDVKTAAIFQYGSAVYIVERPITTAAESFRMLARANGLAPLLTGLFNATPAPIPNATPPLPLAIGIALFDVNVVDPVANPTYAGFACNTPQLAEAVSQRRVEWRYTQYAPASDQP